MSESRYIPDEEQVGCGPTLCGLAAVIAFIVLVLFNIGK